MDPRCVTCSRPCPSNASASQAEDDNDGDLSTQLAAALERARRAEQAFENLKNEALHHPSTSNEELKPLRSQQWFNNGIFSYAY